MEWKKHAAFPWLTYVASRSLLAGVSLAPQFSVACFSESVNEWRKICARMRQLAALALKRGIISQNTSEMAVSAGEK